MAITFFRRGALVYAALGVFIGAMPACAGNYSSAAAGTSSGKFLSFGSSARAAAMGEAYCAAAQGADAVRYNPAALVRVEENAVEVMHASYIEGTFLEHGAFARRLAPDQSIGFSALSMSYGSIEETDEAGYQTGTAHPANLALSGAYAYKLDNLDELVDGGSLGLSVSYIQSRIVSTAKTFTASLGLLSPAYGPHKAQIALVADNLGGTLKFDQKSDPLPMSFKLGGVMNMQPEWTLALDVVAPQDNAAFVAVGTEKSFKTQLVSRLAIRAGYNMRTARDLQGLAGFAAGVGISFRSLTLDYALTPFDAFGYAHRMTLGFKFGKSPLTKSRYKPRYKKW